MLADVVTKNDLYRMAHEAAELGDLSSASEFLQRAYELALALSHNQPNDDSIEALLKLARFYRQIHDLETACHFYEQVTHESAVVHGAEHCQTNALCLEYGMLLTILTTLTDQARRRMN